MRQDSANLSNFLQGLRLERGLTAPEMAKRVREQVGGGSKFARVNIFNYLHGHNFPSPRHLDALSAVLGVDKKELIGPILPAQEIKESRRAVVAGEFNQQTAAAHVEPTVHLVDRGNEVWLQINQSVSWPLALKVLQVLKGEDQ